jgi:hypothetical protein
VSSMVSRVHSPAAGNVAIDVMVEGPEAAAMRDADLRRLFPHGTLTGVRLNRLRNWPRFVVRLDATPAGLATYTQIDGETQIPDFAVDIPAGTKAAAGTLERQVLFSLLNAIELAAMAGACRRIVLVPPREFVAAFERRGYVRFQEGCAGAWMEKPLV